MDMTKCDVCQFLTRGTKNAHCATCAFIPYAGFSQIRSHISMVLVMLLLCSHREVWCCSCCSCVAIEKYGVARVAPV